MNGIHHWEDGRQEFFKAEISNISLGKVYYDNRIISVVKVVVKRKWGYGFLSSIVIRRSYKKEYTFSYADLHRLNLNDIEDMYLLKVQDKLHHLELELKGRYWNEKDIKRYKEMLDKIDQVMKRREQLRRLAEYVGGRPKTIDPRAFVGPV
ncbi:hypothetical protein Tco_1204527 [Tanacetum coccineum]